MGSDQVPLTVKTAMYIYTMLYTVFSTSSTFRTFGIILKKN